MRRVRASIRALLACAVAVASACSADVPVHGPEGQDAAADAAAVGDLGPGPDAEDGEAGGAADLAAVDTADPVTPDTAASDDGVGMDAAAPDGSVEDAGPPPDAAPQDVALPDVALDAVEDAAAPDTGPDVASDVAPDVAPDLPPDTGPTYTLVPAHCGQKPPAGATLAAAPKKYKGTCPQLVTDGKKANLITSDGDPRAFLLLAPKDIQPGEQLPVLVAWHWLKGKAKNFVDQGELAAAVQAQRFVAIVPESKNDIVIPIPFVKNPIAFPWPILTLSDPARFDEEYGFFDDMLACVAEQLPIDKECVSVAGVSAGALFGAQLAAARHQHIASFVSLSGGTWSAQPFVNTLLPKWAPPKHKLPMLVLWGGPNDSCALLNFQAASKSLQSGLDADGHFVVECIHNCGHGVPPVDAPPGQSKFATIWEFAWSHPYWLPAGASPWADGLPAGAPEWCAVGTGNASIRKGACGAPGCPL